MLKVGAIAYLRYEPRVGTQFTSAIILCPQLPFKKPRPLLPI